MRWSLVLALLGCRSDPAAPPAEAGAEPRPEVGEDPAWAARFLSRLSLDLRGVRPSPAELEAVRHDPTSWRALRDAWMQDERFRERLFAFYQEVFLTASSSPTPIFDFAVLADPGALSRSAGEEPVRLAVELGWQDEPIQQLVLADWTVVDGHLGAWWPVDHAPTGVDWEPARYTDGRPAAGVLSTNGFYWSYPSTPSNRQRKRANQITRIFICRDYLLTEVPFEPGLDLSDEEATEDAVASEPSCRACHGGLDPVASYLWGFSSTYQDAFFLGDALVYQPEDERSWVEQTGRAPAWQGQAGDTLDDLGRQIAADPLFPRCYLGQVAEHLLRTPGLELDLLSEPFAQFRAEGSTPRAAFRALTEDARYQAVQTAPKLLDARQLGTAIEALTGYRWTSEGVDLLQDDPIGLLGLVGGVDGKTSTRPATQPGPPSALVLDRLATLAARAAVEREATLAPPERVLFPTVDLEQARPVELSAGLVHLLEAVHGRSVSADDPAVVALTGLWDEVALLAGPAEAWAAVVAALLQDPDFWTY